MSQRIASLAASLALVLACAHAQEETAKESAKAPTSADISKLTTELNADDFKKRENAQIQLTKIVAEHPDLALDTVLKKYIKASAAPEERYRLRSILYGAKQATFKESPPGFVGISMRTSNVRNADGIVVPAISVMTVYPGTAAEKHGLQIGDRIVNIDDKDFKDAQGFDGATNDFAEYVTGKSAGDKVVLSIIRNNVPVEIPMVLGQRPDELYDPRVQNQFDRKFKEWLDENTIRLGGKVERKEQTEKQAPIEPYRSPTD